MCACKRCLASGQSRQRARVVSQITSATTANAICGCRCGAVIGAGYQLETITDADAELRIVTDKMFASRKAQPLIPDHRVARIKPHDGML